jgi:Protein of unknown function (DUF2848)
LVGRGEYGRLLGKNACEISPRWQASFGLKVKNVRPAQRLDVNRIQHLVIAGWTGRDVAALEKHIRELEAIGVKRPKTTPIFYRIAASLLTTDETIEVLGDHSSGEAECVAYSFADGLWIGLGSDHTDRKAEAVGVSLSKQMCAKPVSRDLWRFDDVAPHWDSLVLRSYVGLNGERRLYQEGSVAAMRPLPELFRLYAGREQLPAGTAMFCGTLAVHGEITPSEIFEMELDDPVLQRKIARRYRVRPLPDQG